MHIHTISRPILIPFAHNLRTNSSGTKESRRENANDKPTPDAADEEDDDDEKGERLATAEVSRAQQSCSRRTSGGQVR